MLHNFQGVSNKGFPLRGLLPNQPKILFADEPTGNLDQETGETIEALIFNLNKGLGTTLVLVTHDHELRKKNR